MRFLRVQGQDLPRHFAFRDYQGCDGLSSKAAHGLQAMPAVGSPETTARRHDSDDGVEKTPGLINNVGEPFMVSVGEIALKRRGLDFIDRENRDEGLMTAKRFLVEADHEAASLLDRCGGGRGSSLGSL